MWWYSSLISNVKDMERICAVSSAPSVSARRLLLRWSYSWPGGRSLPKYHLLLWLKQRWEKIKINVPPLGKKNKTHHSLWLLITHLSLNVMDWFHTSLILWKAVGGCPYHDPEDAGNLQLDWLEVQLKMYRNKNMQVSSILFLHTTPPSVSDRFG